jgi:hypothetical protein
MILSTRALFSQVQKEYLTRKEASVQSNPHPPSFLPKLTLPSLSIILNNTRLIGVRPDKKVNVDRFVAQLETYNSKQQPSRDRSV